MNIEQKARAYDEAIERAKEQAIDGYLDAVAVNDIFPELAESEDERIRKSIIELLNEVHFTFKYYDINKMLAWLEKQGEQDAITFNDAHIIDSALNDYCCKQYRALHKENGGVLSFARLQHLAMDIYGWCKKQGEQKPEVDQHSFPVSDDSSLPTFDESIYHPCTEKAYEQKPTDKIEPKFKVGNKIKLAIEPEYPAREIIAIQNDAYYFDEAIYLPFSRQDEWELVEQKPAETEKGTKGNNGEIPNSDWSEEDKQMSNIITSDVLRIRQKCGIGTDEWNIRSEALNWLKSLRPQSQWKPSDAQMASITCAVRKMKESACYDSELVSLYQDLKKL